jgi:triphosphoribosyl-dephospho-CoA synthase
MPVTHDSHIRHAARKLWDACRAWEEHVPPACPPGGVGWAATMACLLEAAAPKPGNVHPVAAFPDLSHDDLVAAAQAIGPVLERAGDRPLGMLILDAVRQSRRVTRSNANLGMILAIAPLAAVPPASWPPLADGNSIAHLSRLAAAVLESLDAADTASIWQAIGEARPGGLGRAEQHDLAGPPPTDILAAMRLAASHDAIAALWTVGYGEILGELVTDLTDTLATSTEWRRAIVEAFLRQLARTPDSLIRRRHGDTVAADVSARAAAVLASEATSRPAAEAALDHSLRTPVRINPGTTADLVAAALYILLRSHTP